MFRRAINFSTALRFARSNALFSTSSRQVVAQINFSHKIGKTGWALSGLFAATALSLYTSNSQPVLAAEGDAKAIPAEADMVHRTKGMYENRLRLMSEPKKIFEYFASLDENGEKFMTPVDFIRSITPYTLNPQEIVGPGVECKEKLAKVKFPDASMGVFHLFDRDGDGKISLAEYLFFTTLLSIPVNMFEAAFHMADTDNSETLDASEFQHLMRVMRSNSPMGAAYRDGFRSNLVKELDEVAIIPQFFGPKGDQALSCKQFIKFLNELQSSIIDLQFRALDFKQEGYISMRDFAMAVVSRGALGSSQFESHLHRAKQIDTHPDFNKESGYLKTHKGVDIDAYRSFFAEAAHLPYMFEVIRLFVQDGDLNRTVFTRAAQIIKLYHKDSNSKGLSAFHINLLFFLFDKDQDGRLDVDEVQGAVQGLVKMPLSAERGFNLARIWKCIKN